MASLNDTFCLLAKTSKVSFDVKTSLCSDNAFRQSIEQAFVFFRVFSKGKRDPPVPVRA